MKTHFFLLSVLTVVTLITTSCGNSAQSKSSSSKEQTILSPLAVDSLLAHAPLLVNQEITVEGICTHTCQHGGTKMFLMGSNDTQTIRIEAGELGSFDRQCVNHIVQIKGILKEQRIDEDYLQGWEAQLKESANKQHGESESGCSTEKQARQESAITPEGRIADFRAKIAQRKAAENKPYLSFYYVEAIQYEIR